MGCTVDEILLSYELEAVEESVRPLRRDLLRRLSVKTLVSGTSDAGLDIRGFCGVDIPSGCCEGLGNTEVVVTERVSLGRSIQNFIDAIYMASVLFHVTSLEYGIVIPHPSRFAGVVGSREGMLVQFSERRNYAIGYTQGLQKC